MKQGDPKSPLLFNIYLSVVQRFVMMKERIWLLSKLEGHEDEGRVRECLRASDSDHVDVVWDRAFLGLYVFFFLTKEFIHAIPHRQPWLHGAYLQSFHTTTTLMKLFLLAYRPQVMTELYSYQNFLILNTITTTSPLLPYPSHPHPIRQHGGEVVPQATLENV